jgi:nucleobase:cation symporter-1, NCS1 family
MSTYDATLSGPTREGDVSLERRGIEPVPEAQRYGRLYRSFTVFFAPNIVPAAFFLGTLATASFIGLGWWTGLVAILLGNVIGSLLAGVLASMGPATGLAQMPVSRASFGKSIAVPGVVNWATSIGWDAINNVFGAAALTLLTGLPFWASLIIIFAGQGVLAIFGYEAIHSFEKWATVVLGAMFLIVTVKVIGVGDFHRAAAVHGGDLVGSFILMTTITASFIIGFSVYASDYTRYLPTNTSRAAIFWRVALGLALSSAWIEILGLAAASALKNEAPMNTLRDLVGGGLLGALAMLAVAGGTVAINAVNDYSGSLSIQAAGIRIPRPVAAAIGAALGFVLTLWLNSGGLGGKFENFLLFVSYWPPAWGAVVLADWWLRRRIDVAAIVDFRRLHSGWRALLAFLAGFVASIPFMNTAIFVGWVPANVLHGGDVAYLVSFVVAGAVYLALAQGVRQQSVIEQRVEPQLTRV